MTDHRKNATTTETARRNRRGQTTEAADAAIEAAANGEHTEAAFCLASAFFAAAQAGERAANNAYEQRLYEELLDNALNAAVLIASGEAGDDDR